MKAYLQGNDPASVKLYSEAIVKPSAMPPTPPKKKGSRSKKSRSKKAKKTNESKRKLSSSQPHATVSHRMARATSAVPPPFTQPPPSASQTHSASRPQPAPQSASQTQSAARPRGRQQPWSLTVTEWEEDDQPRIQPRADQPRIQPEIQQHIFRMQQHHRCHKHHRRRQEHMDTTWDLPLSEEGQRISAEAKRISQAAPQSLVDGIYVQEMAKLSNTTGSQTTAPTVTTTIQRWHHLLQIRIWMWILNSMNQTMLVIIYDKMTLICPGPMMQRMNRIEKNLMMKPLLCPMN